MDQNEELRRDVATANRILERVGLSSAFGHASARLPGTNTFLIPTRRSPGLAEASTLLVLDTEGRVLPGDGEPKTEVWDHARLDAARAAAGGGVHPAPAAFVFPPPNPHPRRGRRKPGGRVAPGGPL